MASVSVVPFGLRYLAKAIVAFDLFVVLVFLPVGIDALVSWLTAKSMSSGWIHVAIGGALSLVAAARVDVRFDVGRDEYVIKNVFRRYRLARERIPSALFQGVGDDETADLPVPVWPFDAYAVAIDGRQVAVHASAGASLLNRGAQSIFTGSRPRSGRR